MIWFVQCQFWSNNHKTFNAHAKNAWNKSWAIINHLYEWIYGTCCMFSFLICSNMKNLRAKSVEAKNKSIWIIIAALYYIVHGRKSMIVHISITCFGKENLCIWLAHRSYDGIDNPNGQQPYNKNWQQTATQDEKKKTESCLFVVHFWLTSSYREPYLLLCSREKTLCRVRRSKSTHAPSTFILLHTLAVGHAIPSKYVHICIVYSILVFLAHLARLTIFAPIFYFYCRHPSTLSLYIMKCFRLLNGPIWHLCHQPHFGWSY